MDIYIKRTYSHGEWTHGHLIIDDVQVCDTLENTSACVPAGSYPVTLIKCHQYGRKMICLNRKAPCSQCPKLDFVCGNTTLPCYCPMLKPGNGVCNRLDGSILIGRKSCLGLIIQSKEYFDALYARIRMSIARGGKVELIVSDAL